MEIINEWRLHVVNGGYFMSHFQLIVCDLQVIPSKTKYTASVYAASSIPKDSKFLTAYPISHHPRQ